MVAWHRSGTADIGLRALGLLLCVIAYLSISHLIAVQSPSPEQAVGAGSFLLAAIGFLSASVGSALTCLGSHLFDPVEISTRWGTGRPVPNDDAPQTHGSSDHDAEGVPRNARLG